MHTGLTPAAPYTFEQLLNRQIQKFGPDLVVHPHVPKSGGITVATLLRQNDFWTLHFNMNTQSFFSVMPEDRFFDHYRTPTPRRAYALTGHFRLDHPILRRLWMPHIMITTLRDPLDRMLSFYNHTLRAAGNPWHAEISEGMSFIDYSKKALGAFGPQYGFFDGTGLGTFAPTGHATVHECWSRFLSQVGLFGFVDRFDEFTVLLGYLLGRHALAITPRNVTREIPNPKKAPSKVELSAAERAELSELLKDDIWFYEEATKEYDRRVANSAIQWLFSETLPLIRASRASAEKILALRDPSDESRRAFERLL
jgi:hypothetical protein